VISFDYVTPRRLVKGPHRVTTENHRTIIDEFGSETVICVL